MKKIGFIALLLTVFISCKEETKPEYLVFEGTITNSSPSKIILSGNDFTAEIAVKDGKVLDTLKISENGYYNLRVGRESTAVYLEKGKNVSFTVETKQFDETISYTGTGAAPNNYLAEKYMLSENEGSFAEVFALPETEFLAEINGYNKTYLDLLNNNETLTESFKELEAKELNYSHISNIENYKGYYEYLSGINDFNVSNTFYDYLKDFNFSDTEAFNSSSAYKNMLQAHFGRLLSEQDDSTEEYNESLAYLKTVDDNFPDGEEKEQIMFSYLRYGMKADAGLEAVYALYKENSVETESMTIITSKYEKLKTLVRGKTSPDFTFENHAGGETSLADLNGKYTYIDVWATWCGPCIREIPSLLKVEEAYHGKNINFVSISIDTKLDYQKWRKMVTAKELGGIQLMADNDWKSKFVTDYGIEGIPRFILLDPIGNIVTSDAPRPSSPDLIALLDSEGI